MSVRARAALCAALLTGPALTGAFSRIAFASPPPRASLPTIERQVMCVSCKIPLDLAQSTQADRERAFIQTLIDRGDSEAQIKAALVAQYGSGVLALPSTHGIGLAAYLVPLVALLALSAALALLLARWRRRTPAAGSEEDPPPALSSAEAGRLEADIRRFD